jgi:hypothetical protein
MRRLKSPQLSKDGALFASDMGSDLLDTAVNGFPDMGLSASGVQFGGMRAPAP